MLKAGIHPDIQGFDLTRHNGIIHATNAELG
jgi:hypothetical protein